MAVVGTDRSQALSLVSFQSLAAARPQALLTPSTGEETRPGLLPGLFFVADDIFATLE